MSDMGPDEQANPRGAHFAEPNPGFFNVAAVKSYEAAVSSLVGTLGRLRDAIGSIGSGSATAMANRAASSTLGNVPGAAPGGGSKPWSWGSIAVSQPVSGTAQAAFTGTVTPGAQDHPQGGTDDRGGFHARVRDYNQQKASFGGYSPGGLLAAAAGGGFAATMGGRALDAAHNYIQSQSPIQAGYSFDILARQRALYTDAGRAANFSALQRAQTQYGTGAEDFASAQATLRSRGLVQPGSGRDSVTGDPINQFTANMYQMGLGTLSGAQSAQVTAGFFDPGMQNRMRGIGIQTLPFDFKTGNANSAPAVFGSILDRMSATGKFQYNEKSAEGLAQGQNWRTSLRALGMSDDMINQVATYGEAAAKAGRPLTTAEVQKYVGTAGTGAGDNGGQSDQQMSDAKKRSENAAALSAFRDAEGSIRAMNTAAKNFADWVNRNVTSHTGAGRTILGAGGIAGAAGHLATTALMLKGAKSLLSRGGASAAEGAAETGGEGILAGLLGGTVGTVGSALAIGGGIGVGASALLDKYGLLGSGHHSIKNVPGNVVKDLKEMFAVGGPDQKTGGGGGENTLGVIESLASRGPHANVTSTYRPGGNSLHARHEAVDFSTKAGAYDDPGDLALNHWWASNYGSALSELIYTGPGGITIKDGKVIPQDQWVSFWGQDVVNQHHNHVHVGLTPDAAKGISSAGGVSGVPAGASPSSASGNVAKGYQSLRWAGGGALSAFASSRPAGSSASSSPAGTVSGGGISAAEQAAYAVGLRGEALATAVAIAGAESSWDPTKHNLNPGTGDDSWGLWQINFTDAAGGAARRAKYGPEEGMTDPIRNAKAMYDISNGGRNWGPWSTFKSGAYERYMAQARGAMPSHAEGSWKLPNDEVAKVHAGEMIVPAKMAEVIRQEIKGTSSGTGTVQHIHSHTWNVKIDHASEAEAKRLFKMFQANVEHSEHLATIRAH